jgi:N-acetylglucosamine transport system substrate-binding protein
VLDLNLGAAIKQGGPDVIKNIDNLEPKAWQQEPLVQATQGIEEMVRKGYFLPGSEGLKHTEAQTQWVQGKAAFYVSGSWIENEMKTISPPDFQMTALPIPVLEPGSAMPTTALRTQPAEFFCVPRDAKNVRGGMEYLRIMLSKKGAAAFAQETASVPVVKGGTDAVAQKTPALASLSAALDAAGDNVFNWQFWIWYAAFKPAVKTEMGNLLAGRTTADGFLSAMQAVADEVAGDPSITKYNR